MLAGKPKGMRYFLYPQRRSPQSQLHARLVQLFKCETRKPGRDIISQGSAIPCHCSLFGGNMTHSPSRVQDGPVSQPAAHLWAPPGLGLKAKISSAQIASAYTTFRFLGWAGDTLASMKGKSRGHLGMGLGGQPWAGESCLVQPQPHLLKTGRCPSYTSRAGT